MKTRYELIRYLRNRLPISREELTVIVREIEKYTKRSLEDIQWRRGKEKR